MTLTNFKRFALVAIIGVAIGFALPSTASAAPKAKSCAITDAKLNGGTVTFTEPQDCQQDLALIAYTAPGPKFDPATAHEQQVFDAKAVTNVGNGKFEWTVKIPACYFQLDFVYGTVLTNLDTDTLYSHRLIAHANGGSVSCSTNTPTTIAAPTTTAKPHTVTAKSAPVAVTTTTTQPIGSDAIGVPVAAEIAQPKELAHTGAFLDRLLRLASWLIVIGSFLGLAAWALRQHKNVAEGRKAKFKG
jgi:hypothetical protein